MIAIPIYPSKNTQKYKIKKMRKANPIHLTIFFILLALIIAPLFFKKELDEWYKKTNNRINDSKIQRVNQEYSLKPVTINLQFSNGVPAILTVPEAYLAFGNDYKKDGTLTDFLSTSQIHIAAAAPELEPWKLTKETLERLQERTSMLEQDHNEESAIYKILREDANFISINLITFFPASNNDVLKIRNKIHHGRAIEEYEKYGLHIYDIEVAIPSVLNGKSVYFYKNGLIADIINIDSYPPMIFACESICTIISNYRGKFGLAVSFNASKLEKWQDIWLKANSKIDSMIKWQ